jgi:NAD(P)-dependent dehydrogenase (short-subunit alcohol dehydrogenase family)
MDLLQLVLEVGAGRAYAREMRASFDFTGGVVIVTGGASGIGAALVRRAADAGATVVVADVADHEAQALAAEDHAPGKLEFEHLDVTSQPAVRKCFDRIRARHGRIDGLVCAAIIQPIGDVADLQPNTWERVIAVNVSGAVWAAQAALPAMREQRSGSIVMFASGTADFGKAGSAPYTTSKGAVAAFARSLAREVAPWRIRVNLCRPGIVNTPMFQAANPGMDTSHLDGPEEPVGALMFLLSDAATMSGSIVTREMAWRAAA